MFCPACAAAVEPGAASCPHCGEVLQGAVAAPVVPVVPAAQIAPVAAVPSQPAAVRRAGMLLWLSVAISLLTLAVTLITLSSRLTSGAIAGRLILFPLLWVVAIFFTMRRNNPARILVILLVAYTAFNLLFRFRLFILGANPGAIVALVELALRGYAVYLLLRPESNEWFAGKQPDTVV